MPETPCRPYVLPTRVHAPLDYLLGALLLAAPWLLGFGSATRAAAPLLGGGALLLLLALLSDHEGGALKRLQMPAHLWIEALLGVALAVSPWALGFDRTAWLPHLIAGLLLVMLAFFTHTIPGYERRRTRSS